ncbi:MAG: sodium:solute symporter [Rhodothermales bacterium]
MTKALLSKFFFVVSLALAPALSAQNLVSVASEDLPDLPSGVSSPLLGSVDGRPVVIGGWVGPVDSAKWSDQAWVLDPGASDWRRLDRIEGSFYPSAAVVTVGSSLVIAGGREASGWSSSVSIVSRFDDQIVARDLPAVPIAVARPSGTANGETVTIGGLVEEPDGGDSVQLFTMDLASESGPAWTPLPPVPVSGMGTLTLAFQNEGLFLAFARDAETGFRLVRYTASEGWVERKGPQAPIDVVAAIALGQAHIAFLSPSLIGSDSTASEKMTIYSYSTITDTWADIGHWEETAENLTATPAGSKILMARRAEGAPVSRVGQAEVVVAKGHFNWLDYTVVGIYLLAMILIGLYFSRREEGTDDFFVGGRRMPWWAVGFSLYATGTSAVSFMAIPAKSYATDWLYWAQNVVGFLAIIPVAMIIVPLIRRLNITSTYEYLEMRFHVAVRLMGSVLNVVYQLGARMSVVLFLPALALSAVTGVDVVPSILIMGVIATLYTALGGIKAVIWTDVVQVIVLFGGALLCLGIIVTSIDGGLSGLMKVVAADHKTRVFDFRFDLTIPSVWLFLIAASADMITWPRDQVMVQRVLSTKSDKEAGFSVWTLAAIVAPGSFMFFALGTALYGFYKVNPAQLSPLLNLDATFPYFIASQLPAGITGLIIAALFAASMSTLDSSMNSVATVIVVDFYKRFKKNATDDASLVLAKWLTVATGIFGTAFALILSRYSMPSLFDTFIMLTGLLGGGFGGVYALGMFTRRANWQGALAGIFASILAALATRAFTHIHVLLYVGIAIFTCIIVGYLVSLFFPAQPDRLRGLTVFKADRAH